MLAVYWMCASFSLKLDIDFLKTTFQPLDLDPLMDSKPVPQQVYPFLNAYVLVGSGAKSLLTVKRYSLTPAWSKDEKVKWATYNARLNRTNEKLKKEEKIYEVPTWKDAFASRHLIVPLSSFRESCREGLAAGHMVDFIPQQDEPLYAAGIYEDWVNKQTGEIVSTFAIITNEPNEYIQNVGHDRSPVILNTAAAVAWLKEKMPVKEAYQFLLENHTHPELTFNKVRALKA